MGMSFDMIGIFVNDLGKMVEFYRDVLGVEVKTIGERYAVFGHEGIGFGMFERMILPELLEEEPTYPSGLNGTFELAIDLPRFEDVDIEFARVVEAGAKPVMEPKDVPWGQRASAVADPENNLIEIASWNRGANDDWV
jgi:lactoylglutathione lyase